LRGWLFGDEDPGKDRTAESMLPTYIQYGVRTPEAAIASLLGIPRAFAEAMGEQYRTRNGPLTPETVGEFQQFVESAGEKEWAGVVGASGVAGVKPVELRFVVRQMQGLAD
jgi:helicase